MPLKSFALLCFEDRILLGDRLVEPGTLPWLLRERPDGLFPAWLFEGWKGATRKGREAWPANTLMSLLLLRHSTPGMSRAGAVRETRVNAAWRAALRLPWSASPPDEKTLREFEAFLRQNHPKVDRPRFEVAFEHWTRLGLEADLVGDEAALVIDSTPMWCFGAVLDTVRLLGDGLRSLAKAWARARKVSLDALARAWSAPSLLAKSTKGHFEGTDWADPVSRGAVLSQLAASVTCATEQVQAALSEVRENKRKSLLRLCRSLLSVVSDDLTPDAHGVLQIVHRTTSARLISVTDPDAQHFRKSKSQVFAGYKLHVLGDAISGLVLALSVTPGGAHDNTQAHPLIARAKALHAQIHRVLADAAYGGMPVRKEVREHDQVEILAPPGATARGTKLGKKDYAIDFEAMIATCPGGVRSCRWAHSRQNGQLVPTFYWAPGSAEACTCRDQCPAHNATRGRLQIHPDEQELRAIRADWETPATRQAYRLRSRGERLIREMTRRGARRAAAWGIDSARLQAHCAGAVHNLLVLARHLANDHAKRAAA